jgi:hypothetical protein
MLPVHPPTSPLIPCSLLHPFLLLIPSLIDDASPARSHVHHRPCDTGCLSIVARRLDLVNKWLRDRTNHINKATAGANSILGGPLHCPASVGVVVAAPSRGKVPPSVFRLRECSGYHEIGGCRAVNARRLRTATLTTDGAVITFRGPITYSQA